MNEIEKPTVSWILTAEVMELLGLTSMHHLSDEEWEV